MKGLRPYTGKTIRLTPADYYFYVTTSIPSRRILTLEHILPESIWIGIKDKSYEYLICNVYRPPQLSVEFWDRLNICLENASEIANRIILVGDINEDQLNPANNKFRNILLINNMKNVINEPTRLTDYSRTLLDPIAVTENLVVYDHGTIHTPSTVSDHYGTYVYVRCNLHLTTSFKRKVWNYKRGNFNLLNHLIRTADWSLINTSNGIDTTCEIFSNKLSELLQVCIPSSLVTIRPNDKPWYNSLIRRTSRQREPSKNTAQSSNKTNDWTKYKTLRNRVNNMKK